MNRELGKFIDGATVDNLVEAARAATRRRKNLNLHPELADPIQRLLNAGEPGTYVRAHRHALDRWELIVAIRGRIDALFFDDKGVVTERLTLDAGTGSVLEVAGGQWHSFVFVNPGTVALEIKQGPYVAETDKTFAMWAPLESAAEAASCATWLASASIGDRWHPG